jgi:serine phosphatase RsbU (regulator of sigma subunit)
MSSGNGEVDILEANIPILGITPITPEIQTRSLPAHSSLFLYTDGIYEWRTPNGTFFDQERFLKLAQDLLPEDGPFLTNLMQAMQTVTSQIPFRDDVTALYLYLLPTSDLQSNPESISENLGQNIVSAYIQEDR